ncbi:helix-turn-helix domain-containing protein [Micropruina sonneratiae]|uniref:helix-turn-helix domain-containing protein n=1 Tax=Micropruina sonneratiae TaxID=2986940 RepID=UPI0022278991|nr:helix-turn-helix domain-containing protein [Micropruina sp. KQZ13P-5]MCW3159013.1 helix-turn-helix domain-containing protein [Micropruina sp. KQZ13P-5]
MIARTEPPQRRGPAAGPDPLAVGKRVRHRRKAAGLTLDTLGARVGVSASALSLIETGRREAKVSVLAGIADVLGCTLADLLDDAPPSRRAALELQLERAQQSPAFAALGVQPVRTGPRLPMDALESLVALHGQVRSLSIERDGTPEYARRANAGLRRRMLAADNHFPAIESLADDLLTGIDHDGGPLTWHNVRAIAARLGFTLQSAPDLPRSTRSIIDRTRRRVFLPSAEAATLRTVALSALGHVVLEHRPPGDYAEFLAQRVEVNYFAAAVLVPQRWAVPLLQEARRARDLEIADLRDRYLTSYEMAAHRFTNLATVHLDIPVHFMKINASGVIQKAYANDGVAFPSDATGAIEGQRVCRYWTARAVFDQPDWTEPYQQYTDTPSGTFWCTALAEHVDGDAHSVSVGTPYEHVRWFRGRDTPHRSASRCPDPACCTEPSAELAQRWRDAWPSSRVHSALLASLPAGEFAGIDRTEVTAFLERQP